MYISPRKTDDDAVGNSMVFPENCRPGDGSVPGVATICDLVVDCVYCERNHLTFDFLCCEGGQWVGMHLTMPLIVYLFLGDALYTLFFVMAFEVFECVLLTFIGGFVALFESPTDVETWAASAVGDVFIQGVLGVLFGSVLAHTWRAPPMLPGVQAARRTGHVGRRAVYATVFAVMLACSLFNLLSDDISFRTGLLLVTLSQLFIIWAVLPFCFTRPSDYDLLWARPDDGTVFRGPDKFFFFLGWGLVLVVAHAPHFAGSQPTFATNEWFQQWLFVAPWFALYAIVGIIVAAWRGDAHAALTVSGCLAFAAAVASVVYDLIVFNTSVPEGALGYLGLVLFGVSVTLFIAAQAVMPAPLLAAKQKTAVQQPFLAPPAVSKTWHHGVVF